MSRSEISLLSTLLRRCLCAKSTFSPAPPDEYSYFDHQSTTPLDPRVLDAMMPYMTWNFGNPHSRTHKYGWDAEKAVENAREQVAALISARDKREIVFTSGATEANNLAIKGVARFYRHARPDIVTSQIEHKCVLDSCRSMEQEGSAVSYVLVNKHGILDLDAFKASVSSKSVAMASVMAVNNEIGVIQPINVLGKMCRDNGVFFHSDAAQAAGKIDLNVEESSVDLMSISSHKLYGPKGIGALYVRRRPRVRLDPIFSGGGQERGLRSGTVPPFLAVGFGAACQIAKQEMEFDGLHVREMATRLLDGISRSLDHVSVNGSMDRRYPGCLNLSFACVEGESLMMALKRFALSSGSACTSASLEPSYVLRAIGIEEDLSHSSIRFGISRFTTKDEIDKLIDNVVREVTRLRELSPLWEMVQEGIDLKAIKWT